jgi:hypothetical protein
MGDSNTKGAANVHRSGANNAGARAVKAAFTKSGTLRAGVSQAKKASALKVLGKGRQAKIAGRKAAFGEKVAFQNAAYKKRLSALAKKSPASTTKFVAPK